MAATNERLARKTAREKAVERIAAFAQQFGEPHVTLACHAAFPLVLTPDLLYDIWANFVPRAPWTAVADVLLSPLCREVGNELYEIDIATRELLLEELNNDERFGRRCLEELAGFLTNYVAQQIDSADSETSNLARVQRWTTLAYTRPSEAARELAESLSKAVLQGDKAELIRVAAAVEAFAEPLAGFEPLLTYARGAEDFAHGRINDARAEFDRVVGQEKQIRMIGVTLHIPEQALMERVFAASTIPPDTIKFVDREAELAMICNPAGPHLLVVDAPAGYGKTYLLRRAKQLYIEQMPEWKTAYIDLKSLPSGAGEEYLIEQIAWQIIDRGSTSVEDLAAGIAGQGHSVVILVDSCENNDQLTRYLEDHAIPELRERLRLPGVPVRVVFAGRHLSTFGHWPQYQIVPLAPFNETAILELLLSPEIEAGVQLSRDAIDDVAHEILFLSGGHPGAIQRLLTSLIDRQGVIGIRDRSDRRELFDRYVSSIVDELLAEVPADYREVLAKLSIFRQFNANTIMELQSIGEFGDIGNLDPLSILSRLVTTGLISSPSIGSPYFIESMCLRRLLCTRMYLEQPKRYYELNQVAYQMYGKWVNLALAREPDNWGLGELYLVEAFYHYLEGRESIPWNEVEVTLGNLFKSTRSIGELDLRQRLGYGIRQDADIVHRLEGMKLHSQTLALIDQLAESSKPELVQYYADRIEGEHDLIERQQLSLQRLHYWLDTDLESAFTYSRNLFENAAEAYDTKFMETINDETLRVRDSLSPPMQRELELREAIVLGRREPLGKAAEKMAAIARDPECESTLRASAWVRLVELYASSGSQFRAIESGLQGKKLLRDLLDQMHADDPKRRKVQIELGLLCNNLGFAYRLQNDYHLALECWEEALENLVAADAPLLPMARVKNNLGFLYYRLGRIGEALAECETALKIRERLGNPYELGLSYHVLGTICADAWRVEEAETYFKQALEAFDEAKSQAGQATVCVSYGRLLRQLGWYREAIAGEPHNSGRGEYLRAGTMLDSATDYFQEAQMLSNLSEALNEKGTLLRQQERWDEAITCFERSIDLARRIGIDYREIDSLQDIAVLYEKSGQLNLALQYAERASKKALRIDAHHLLARAQRTVANVMFMRGDFDQAFRAAGNACVYAVMPDLQSLNHSPERKTMIYQDCLKWLEKMLMNLQSKELLRAQAEYLIKCWEQAALSEQYPDFVYRIRNLVRDYGLLASDRTT